MSIRGDVYRVRLDPTVGSGIRKTRPGVVLSNNIQNQANTCLIIAPFTSVISKVYSFEVVTHVTDTPSKIMLDQIRTIDKRRLGERVGTLNDEEIDQVDKALKYVLGLR